MEQELILLKITKSIKNGADYFTAIRGDWPINKKRFPYIQYLIGISEGDIVCAFKAKPNGWNEVPDGKYTIRKYHMVEECEEAPEICDKAKKARDILLSKFGYRKSVAYAYSI